MLINTVALSVWAACLVPAAHAQIDFDRGVTGKLKELSSDAAIVPVDPKSRTAVRFVTDKNKGGKEGFLCYYDGDDFIVNFEGREYSASADDDSQAAVVSCSDGVSAMYDGDDLIVFNPRTRTFRTHSADDNSQYARLSASDALAVFYDGDDVFVYRADKDSFIQRSADDNSPVAEVIAGGAAAMAWDGDDLLGYCMRSETWTSSSSPDDDEGAVGQVSVGNGGVGMSIGEDNFTLDPGNCSIRETSQPGGLACRYDGDDFLVKYQGRDYSYSVDDDFREARVSCGGNTAVMYDGDDIIVFDGIRRAFSTHSADDASVFAAAIAGRSGALAYDGDDIIGYCANGSWATKYADDNAEAVTMGGPMLSALGIKIGSDTFVFDPAACAIREQ